MLFCLKYSLVKILEKIFYSFGYFVAQRPITVIIISLLTTLLCSIGFLNLSFETDANKIWGPDTSIYIANNKWLNDNFPQDKRLQTLIFQSSDGENILSPKSLQSMLKLHKKIANVNAKNTTFETICHRVPISSFFGQKNCRRKRSLSRKRTTRGAIRDASSFVPQLDDTFDYAIGENSLDHRLFVDGSGNKVISKIKSKSLAIVPEFETSALKVSPSIEEKSEYDYDSVYDYDYNNDYSNYDYESEKEDCNDFTHIIESSSHTKNEKPLSDLPSNVYCDIVNTLETKCLEQSLLEIWMYHEDTINRLTQEDILFAINKLDRSPYFGFTYNYTNLLGSIHRNESGHIIGASSTMHHFVTVVDLDNLSTLGLADAGTEPAASLDEANYQWQQEVIDKVLEEESDENETVRVRVRMTRSFTDVSSAVVFLDLRRVIFCVIIMFIYTSLMLGKFDLVHQRVYLTAMGMISVLMGIVIALGIIFALGYPYMPHFAILPFIMIGLGIDDMFVIVESWYNLDESEKKKNSIEENIALTLKESGVAITVTSITDICAFSIGCVTILPGLKAFCLTCAIGIAAVYLLQVSWFVAWLRIDQKRIDSQRNGVLPCIVHKGKENNSDIQDSNDQRLSWKNIGKYTFKCYGSLVDSKIYAVFVIFATIGLLSGGLYGTLNIRQEYNEVNMIPPDTYLRKWFDNVKEDYKELGQHVKLFTGPINSTTELKKLDRLLSEFKDLKERNLIIKDIDSWWITFKNYIDHRWNISDWETTILNSDYSSDKQKTFEYLISEFLHSEEGGKYKSDIIFNNTLICGKEAPQIIASSSDIIYRAFDGPSEHIPSVQYIEDLIKFQNFSFEAFTNGRIYGIWEIDKVIVEELWRNLGCSIVCVLLITYLLLSDIISSIQVLFCVVFTLVDVVGGLYFWNITIDVISCCCIIVTVGLCVDYSAHIAHAFLVSSGSRLERAQKSLHKIGPAVINGGATTFLAVVLLCDSKSHAFITFFKVFFLTVLFGLYHAIIFLPVILSFENPFRTTKKDKKSSEIKEGKYTSSKFDEQAKVKIENTITQINE